MRWRAVCVLCTLSCVMCPVVVTAQTSTIAGTVKDESGAAVPGVTVEVASPALIEKVRTGTSDREGKYAVVSLRPGIYTVTFTLKGFTTVTREAVELTSDFTATVNAVLTISALQESIIVRLGSPSVETSAITQRVVMTRDVLDAMPTGRNIQAVGVLIPGTQLAIGGGAAISRDVGGSGGLQQSPLQYRGSGDTVQTIEGLRLNNLCAQGAYSGVYWNDASFEELSYITGADSADMGQGGIRINMVPRDGGNQFRGQVFASFADSAWASDNCGSPGIGQPCTRANLTGSTTFNRANTLTNVDEIKQIWDINPSVGGPIKRDRLWFHYTFRHWGVDKTKADSYFDLNPSPFVYTPDTTRKGIDDGHIVSNAGRVSWAATTRDKVSVYHDNQRKYRNHQGISAMVPPEAAAVQVTPTSFVNVTKWTRVHTNRLLLEGGFGYYNQETVALYQPSVTLVNDKVWDLDVIRNLRHYTVLDQSTNRIANVWSTPADQFSVLRTFMGAASYVTGSHNVRFGATVTNGDWRVIEAWSGDVQPITYNAGRPVQVTLRLPTDRRNGIKADTGLFVQDRWAMGRFTWNLGLRYDWFIGETRDSEVLPNRFNSGARYGTCPDGKANPTAGCAGTVQNWKDISPRVGFAMDVFGNGRTALRASLARYVAGQNVGVADQVNPVRALGLLDTRPWNDLDGNGLPLSDTGDIQFNELSASTATASFGLNIPITRYDPEVLNGWGKRGYNLEWTVAAQHQLAERLTVSGGYYRRTYGNQTFVDDLRFDASSFDTFCVTAPADPQLPGGGGYPVCGVQDLKPALFVPGQTANNLLRFSDDYGGETNLFQGYDISIEGRFGNAAFLKAGIAATSRTFDNCNLIAAGLEATAVTSFSPATIATQGTEIYPDGTKACHREYPYRPDAKISGAYLLPWGIQIAGTYQYTRGVQTGGAGPSIAASWAITRAVAPTVGAREWTEAASRTVNLIHEGQRYGDHDLSQLDLRLGKRFDIGRARLRLDFDVYNVFNSSWPFTVNASYSTSAASVWLRPTNVLQSRFFKLGGQIGF